MKENQLNERRTIPTPFEVRPNNESAKAYDETHWWVYYAGGVLEIFKLVNGVDQLQAVYSGSWTLTPIRRGMARMP